MSDSGHDGGTPKYPREETKTPEMNELEVDKKSLKI